MAGSNYWQERYLKDKARSINLSEKYIKGKLKKYYTEAGKEIEAEIESFYEKYAKDEEITLAEARKRISSAEFNRSKFEKMAKETAALKKKYGKNIPEGIAKQIEDQERILNTLSKKGAITRLQGLQANIDNAILKLYDKQQLTMYDILKDGYEDGYYREIFRIQQQIGIGTDFTAMNERAIRQAVTANHGKGNFSSRLYKHSKTLSRDLQENLTVGLIRGESVDKMAKRISRRLDVSMSNAKRLVRTETAYIHELATMESYKEAGIEKYRFLATLDNKTSEICQELDRKEFPVEKAIPGENLPPMHPNCRSTTEAVFEDEIESYRTARASDGSQYMVPRDMNYEEWKKKYVKANFTVTNPEMLQIPDNMIKMNKDMLIKEINMIPESHKSIMESAVTQIIIDTTGNSRYDVQNGILYLKEDFEKGEIIHELAHALENALRVYDDGKFLVALKATVGEVDALFGIEEDTETFVKSILVLRRKENLISEYQGRVYEEVPRLLDDMSFNYKALGDFFAEAYRAYIFEPEVLKAMQPEIYKYIEELVN